MLIREMMRQECEDVSVRLSLGRLACSRDNQPYMVRSTSPALPLPYGFATMGRKVEWMRLNPLVCVEADQVRSHMDWASVVAKGRYEEFPDTPEYSNKGSEHKRCSRRRGLCGGKLDLPLRTRERFDRDITIFYGIYIDELTGRRASADPVEQPR